MADDGADKRCCDPDGDVRQPPCKPTAHEADRDPCGNGNSRARDEQGEVVTHNVRKTEGDEFSQSVNEADADQTQR